MSEPCRLNASAQTGHGGQAEPIRPLRTCLECGIPYEASERASQFCATSCRQTWNNRRLKRGAELYDLFMPHRFERPLAKGLKLISLLNRLASIFRAEDLAERGGRASWRPPEVVLSERPYLRAQILRQTKGGAHE